MFSTSTFQALAESYSHPELSATSGGNEAQRVLGLTQELVSGLMSGHWKARLVLPTFPFCFLTLNNR